MTEGLQRADLVLGDDEPIECWLDLAQTSLGAGSLHTTLTLVIEEALLARPQTVSALTTRLLRLADAGGRVDVRAPAISVRRARCGSVGVAFTAFAAGEPVRALATIVVTDPSAAGVVAERGTHQLMPGEDLPGVAYAVYGDASRWRLIAEASEIDDPLAVRPGEILILPTPEA